MPNLIHRTRPYLIAVLATGLIAVMSRSSMSADQALVVPVGQDSANETLPEADQLAFATSYVQAFNDGDSSAINGLFDWNLLLDEAMTGEHTPAIDLLRKQFKAGFLEALHSRGSVFS